ncbi:endo alpha-1,4 polygalactosaminidase [Paraburkholderia rhynchosiae]|uniref:Glycoside-hydrolase family GH114 TIM-barrel domain-containing protein n=1 Tax=Paraburkholderia rhynchosiae TaxID=487049 RepID=A0A2N7W731_9BURK|nr:endo alpha-1,4 polygalactosaminidase [Paraburkholderia rhynchosiae]PMS25216.1 hypothetical protein C0Z16_29770 [Paraburkholderia rhynchosiae]CAB3719301.1 hypothetical protein LMG27174_04818 [Paraburkholderia rhynchosiae]
MSIERRQRCDMCAFYRRLVGAARLVIVGLLSSIAHERAWADAGGAPSIALYYGTQPPVSQLRNFDVAVVEPDSGFEPLRHKSPRTAWFAYVSVGEVEPQRPYYAAIPKAWQLGDNAVWGAKVIDQDAADWPAFYVEHVIAPLWKRGYRGFFLDTLDSYQLVAKTDAARTRQERGLVAVVRAIKTRFPGARLIFNRGFEILPQVHSLVYVVAFESLYRGWDQAGQRYTEIVQADRDWLLGQANTIRERYRLPVLAIDYCAPADGVCSADTVSKISAAGIVPYVTDGGLQTVGAGPVRAGEQ